MPKEILKLIQEERIEREKLQERLNKALESGTAVAFHGIYHKTINTRIKNICNALGMDLNGSISPKITALEEEQQAFIKVCQEPCKDCKLNDLEILLRDHIQLDSSDPDLLNYNTYEAYNDALLEKLDSKSGGEKDKDLVRLKGMPHQRLEAKSDSKLPAFCEECNGYRMGERMIHKNWCSQCTTSTTIEKTTPILKPTEMTFEYIDGSDKPIKYDGLIQKSVFVKDLRDLHDFSLVPPGMPQEQINMIRFKIEQLLIKYA